MRWCQEPMGIQGKDESGSESSADSGGGKPAGSAAESICLQCNNEYNEPGICPVDGGLLIPKRHLRLGAGLIGTVFADRYQLTDILGEGSTGIVYKAKHLMMERTVAVKILKSVQTSRQQALKNFQQEARSASGLNHPRLVVIHDFGISLDGDVYIVMGFIEGQNLESAISREGFLETDRAVRIMLQVCEGLQHAHSKGIVHRDIKPANIIITDANDEIKIVDFGIAKVLPSGKYETFQISHNGQICGSPLFMSPEQCANRIIDARSDIYSLGATLYYALVGHPPFYGSTIAEIVYKHLKEPVRKPSSVNRTANISAQLDEVIVRCLQKEPDLRYQSVEELDADLRKCTSVPAAAVDISSFRVDSEELLSRTRLDHQVTPSLGVQILNAGADAAQKQQNAETRGSGNGKAAGSPALAQSSARIERTAIASGDHSAALASLARKHIEQQEFDLAESLLQGAIALVEKAAGKEDLQLCKLCCELGELYASRNKYSAAENVFVRALKITRECCGTDDLLLTDWLDRLAYLYQRMQKFSEAENLYLRSLEMRLKQCSPKSEQTARSYSNLGELYRCMNRLDEADYMQRRAAAILEDRLSETAIGQAGMF